MTKRRSVGVTTFGILICVSSMLRLISLIDFHYYRFMFQQLSEQVIMIRYIFSIFIRVIGLVSGIGILFLNNNFRRLALALSLFTLLTIFWKHPYYVFENIAYSIHEMEIGALNAPPKEPLQNPSFPLISMIVFYMVDISFAGSFIYFFTRKGIKQQFV